jgi:O-acetyl-ADP-ribose deacetylase (regulator of RNase III)
LVVVAAGRTSSPDFWTNASVRNLVGNDDPVAVVVAAARSLVVSALDDGWTGPPYDPIVLADRLKVPVVPRDDVFDARLVPVGEASVQIEYNPSRPVGRRRFSLAHEVAHLLFPDHRNAIRNRAKTDRGAGDDWQLEALCNLAAAEFVMPVGSFYQLASGNLDLRELLELRLRFDVSTEALLLRATRLSSEPAAVFAASRTEPDGRTGRYRVDYTISSSGWDPTVRLGGVVVDSAIAECAAIGFTAHGQGERWPGSTDLLRVDAVGIPPYPGHRLPRVVGLLRPSEPTKHPRLQPVYLVGDALSPRGTGNRLIVHVVNDRARHWKGAFANSLRARWPAAASAFTAWVDEDRRHLRLGSVHMTHVDTDLWTAALVAQAGYGPAAKPRVRYSALRAALAEVADWAVEHSASVHMPRIATGQAGGTWAVVRELVDSELCGRGVPVSVYDLPGQRTPDIQGVLALDDTALP